MHLDSLMKRLEVSVRESIDWFECNGMKLNSKKCHLLVCGHKFESMICKIGNTSIIVSNRVKLLGLSIDSKLSFDDHMSSICKKASQKLNALSRQCAFLPFYRRKLLMNAFFHSQFSHCPLTWMFHSRSINTKINNLHFRALRIVYKDESLSFQNLLDKDNSITIHQRNLRSLATEMFKVTTGLSPTFMIDVFCANHNLDTNNFSARTRLNSRFYNPVNPKKVYMGSNSLRCLGPKIWNMVPNEVRESSSLSMFKARIKKWKPSNCPCRLCLTYIPNLGFI